MRLIPTLHEQAKVKKIERDEALVEVGKAGDALVLSKLCVGLLQMHNANLVCWVFLSNFRSSNIVRC